MVTGLPATGELLLEVTKYLFAAPTAVVMVALVPVKLPPSVPVTVVAVPATVCVVKTTVAIPEALVWLVAVAKDPFAFDLLQVTVKPAVLTGLLLASASWAVIFAVAPAVGVLLLEVTRYFVAAPTAVVMVALVPVRLAPSVPVTVVAVPARVWVVKTTVAIPLPSVLLVAVAKDPFAFDLLQVTTCPAVLTGLLLASAS